MPFLFTLIVVTMLLPGPLATAFIQEGGVVETLSVVGYLLCCVAMGFVFRGRVLKYWPAIVLLLAMAARELDFQKIWTTESITRGRYYFNAGIPLMERLIVVAALMALACTVVFLLKNHLLLFLHDLKRRQPYAIAIAMGIALVGFSKLVDGADRKLKGFGIEAGESSIFFLEALEEIFEMGIPICFFIAILSLRRSPPPAIHPALSSS